MKSTKTKLKMLAHSGNVETLLRETTVQLNSMSHAWSSSASLIRGHLTTAVLEMKTCVADEKTESANLQKYINAHAQVQVFIDKGDTQHAKRILLELRTAYPLYPETFVKLGDLHKVSQPELALFYYSTALSIVPFDYSTEAKLAQLTKKNHDPSFAQVRKFTIENSLKKLKEMNIKAEEYRITHQKCLHKQLVALKIRDQTALTDPATCDFKTDLSSGAAHYVFKAFNAGVHKLPALAKYFFLRATLQYKHDFIAQTELAFMHFEFNNPRKAVTELGKIADQYQYAATYIRLYKVYVDLRDYRMARTNLCFFLAIAQRNDLDQVQELQNELTEFLQYNVLDEHESKSFLKALSKKTLPDSEATSVAALLTSQTRLTLAQVNASIMQYPRSAKLYNARAELHKQKGDWLATTVDYTMAMWYSGDQCLNYYRKRFLLHLMLGHVVQAQLDYDAIVNMMEEDKCNPDRVDLLTALKIVIGDACSESGKNYENQADYATAEALYRFGANVTQREDFKLACGQMKYIRTDGKGDPDENDEVYLYFLNHYLGKSLAEPSPCRIALEHEEIKIAAPLVDVQKSVRQRRKKNEKPKAVLLTSAPRKRNTVQPIQCNEDKSPLVEVAPTLSYIAMVEKEREDRLAKAAQKRLASRLKKKDKKHESANPRKFHRQSTATVFSDSPSPEPDVINSISLEASATSSTDAEIHDVSLSEFEIKAFATIVNPLPKESRDKYRTYLVGGWAYDSIRKKMLGVAPCPYNDADFVTEVPPHMLAKNFYPIHEVPGLYCGKIDGIKIDVVYEPDLSNLLKEAKSRDFLTLYIAPDGKVSDPTGFALTNMRQKRLSGAHPPADMFKADPLVILRAVYLATKRDLNINCVRDNIKTDRELLIPKRAEPGDADRRFHARRFNLRITKLFSQKLATQNFKLLASLGILNVLFPLIYPEMIINKSWLEGQINITNTIAWPKIQFIYANFIACAVVMRVPELELRHLPATLQPSKLATEINTIWNGSLLFQDSFASPAELFNYLKAPLETWKLGKQLTGVPMESPVSGPVGLRV